MKNLLSENMLRFGTKNLSESQKRALTLESIMQTINEHGLAKEVRRRLTEAATSFDQTTVQFASGQPPALTPGQAIGLKHSYFPYSFIMKNGPKEAIITNAQVVNTNRNLIPYKNGTVGVIWSSDRKGAPDGFVVTAKGKSFPLDSTKGGYIVPANASFRINMPVQIMGMLPGMTEDSLRQGRENPGDVQIKVEGNFPTVTKVMPAPSIITNPSLGQVSPSQAMAKLGISGT